MYILNVLLVVCLGLSHLTPLFIWGASIVFIGFITLNIGFTNHNRGLDLVGKFGESFLNMAVVTYFFCLFVWRYHASMFSHGVILEIVFSFVMIMLAIIVGVGSGFLIRYTLLTFRWVLLRIFPEQKKINSN